MKKWVTVLLTMMLTVVMLNGCGEKTNHADQTNQNLTEVDSTVLPIVQEPLELSIWCNNYASRTLVNYGDQEAWKEISKKTGIDIEFIHPTGGATEQLNIMLATGDYPDIIYHSWGSNLSKYINNGVAMPLNDYLPIMPNIRKLMQKYEDVARQITLADGTIAGFPQINSPVERDYWDGYFVRQDWLDKLNLEAPQTIEDWETVLAAFKNQDPNGNGEADEIPFSSTKSMMPEVFISAFGVIDDLYLNPETQKVSYGALDEGYKEYLTAMHRWYEAGYIDNEYLSVDQKNLDEKMLNGVVGSSYMDNNNSMINYLNNKPSNDFDLSPLAMPKSKSGEIYYPRKNAKEVISSNKGVITSACKYPVEAVKLLDYLYSDESTVLFNWGIENKSYVEENGVKKYTDEILNNPDGKTPYEAIAKYCINQGFMKLYDYNAIIGLDASLTPDIKSRRETSTRYAAEASKDLILPPLVYTEKAYTEYSKIITEVRTYIDEMKAKFIIGKESLDNYDEFLATLESLNLKRAVEIGQAAYDEYMNR